jgi:hypothetical protein
MVSFASGGIALGSKLDPLQMQSRPFASAAKWRHPNENKTYLANPILVAARDPFQVQY